MATRRNNPSRELSPLDAARRLRIGLADLPALQPGQVWTIGDLRAIKADRPDWYVAARKKATARDGAARDAQEETRRAAMVEVRAAQADLPPEDRVRVRFPLRSYREELVKVAREHAIGLDHASGQVARLDSADETLVVNWLRHQCTDYDRDQSAARHRAACEAIAHVYPWLSDECRRQIDRRQQQPHP